MITSKWKMKKGSIHHQQKKIVPDENKKILEIQSRKVGKNLLRDFFFALARGSGFKSRLKWPFLLQPAAVISNVPKSVFVCTCFVM